MSDIYRRLLDAIKEHSGLDDDEIRQAGEYGADTGWLGFTYTIDAAEFYRSNADLVDELLQDGADSFGYPNVAAFVASFNRADMADTRDGLDNLKAWYALEEVGRWLEDLDEEEASTPHVWQTSRFTETTTCERCGLLPLDEDDTDSPCDGRDES
jgi:hypothetical protein